MLVPVNIILSVSTDLSENTEDSGEADKNRSCPTYRSRKVLPTVHVCEKPISVRFSK